MPPVDATPDLSRRRWLILLSALLSFFAVAVTFFAVPPLVPELARRFALSHLEIGILMGAIAVPAIFLSIPLGAAIDRWPARAVGNGGLLAMVVGSVIFALAPSYAVLLVGRILFGIGGLVINLLLARLITRAFAGRELALAMGLFNATYPAGMIVMFSFHPRLVVALGWRGELLVLAALVLLAIPLHNLVVPGRLGGATRLVEDTVGPRVTRPLAALAVSWMLFFAAFASVFTFAPEWAGGGPQALLTVTLVTWVSLLLNPVVGILIDRWGHAVRWVVCGELLLAVVLGLMAAGLLAPVPAMLLIGLTAASVPTATYSLPGRLVPAARVGFAFGFITAFSNLGTLAGPAAAGALRDAVGGWSIPWATLAVLALLGAIAALLVGPGRES
ncbi:MAG: MFS transporter [Acidobacteria bacterium]|nr:MFS transporter [Acidobacteriota bacterium]